MKTDKDLLRLIGAGSDTPPHVACRCFAADLRRVYDAGKAAPACVAREQAQPK